jgi:hypothetical protein
MKVDDSRESVVLRTERGMRALPLLRVVIGGLASRQDLLLEQVDDVQLAVESLLAEEPQGEGEIVLQVWCEDSGLSLRLDGLVNVSVKTALQATSPFEPCEDCLLDVRVLLESLVDTFAVVETPEGHFAVQMDKWA